MSSVSPPKFRAADPANADAVVSYNVAAIRRRRGWTQEQAAERLAGFTGRRLPKSSMSNMERGLRRGRTRRFNAHELYLFSVVFDVPIAYFFLPSPGAEATELADTGRPLVDLYASALGTDDQLVPLDERLAEIQMATPDAAEAVLGALYGAGPDWARRFRAWRHSRLEELSRHYAPQLTEAAGLLGEFAEALRSLGPRAFLEATAKDAGEVSGDASAPSADIGRHAPAEGPGERPPR